MLPRQFRSQGISDLTRLLLGGLSEHHRRVRRHVAMRHIARRRRLDALQLEISGQRTLSPAEAAAA